MIAVTLTNDMLSRIIAIEQRRSSFSSERIPISLSSHMRKMSRKRSAHSSTKIEGNPLTEEQALRAIDDRHRHFLKPEEEVRNYYAALQLLDECLAANLPIDEQLLLNVQRIVVAGSSAEKVGLRGPMPPGVLFAVYDSTTGAVEYIPPEHSDVPKLLAELFDYVATADDHPLVKAGVIHYQLVTIHPFEDGNGRTARLLSGYYLAATGFGFGGLGSLEEYFAYDVDDYYRSLQMGLPALYYNGRDNPPHPEIWMEYFLRMVDLYSERICQVAADAADGQRSTSLSHLSKREQSFYEHLTKHGVTEFRPVDMARELGVSNRTIINWSAALAKVGLLEPQLVTKRIVSYKVI